MENRELLRTDDTLIRYLALTGTDTPLESGELLKRFLKKDFPPESLDKATTLFRKLHAKTVEPQIAMYVYDLCFDVRAITKFGWNKITVSDAVALYSSIYNVPWDTSLEMILTPVESQYPEVLTRSRFIKDHYARSSLEVPPYIISDILMHPVLDNRCTFGSTLPERVAETQLTSSQFALLQLIPFYKTTTAMSNLIGRTPPTTSESLYSGFEKLTWYAKEPVGTFAQADMVLEDYGLYHPIVWEKLDSSL